MFGRVDYVQLFSSGHRYESGGRLSELLGKTAQAVTQRLQSWDADDLLNTPVDDVVARLVDQGAVQCPYLRADDAFLLEPTEIDQQFMDFGERYTRRVPRLVLVVPFEGDNDVFTLRANTSSTMPPQVLRLQDHEIHLAIDNPSNDPAAAG